MTIRTWVKAPICFILALAVTITSTANANPPCTEAARTLVTPQPKVLEFDLNKPDPLVEQVRDEFGMLDLQKAAEVTEKDRSELEQVLDNIKRMCGTDGICLDEAFKSRMAAAAEQHATPQESLAVRIFRYPLRVVETFFYLAVKIGAPIASFLALRWLNVDSVTSAVLSCTMAACVHEFMEPIGAPVEEWLETHLRKFGYMGWIPRVQQDHWARISGGTTANHRNASSAQVNDMGSYARHIDEGAKYLREGNLDMAGEHFATAAIHTFRLYNGVNAKIRTTVREVRTALRSAGWETMTPDQKAEVIVSACRAIYRAPSDEVAESERAELTQFTFDVMLWWFVVHDMETV